MGPVDDRQRSRARPPSVPAEVLKFAALALCSLLAIAVASAVLLGRQTRTEAIRDAKNLTTLAVAGIVEPLVTPGVLAGDRAAVARLDRAVRERVLRGPVVRVKLWDRSGRVLYSDERGLIGRRFPLGADEIAALEGGRADAAVSDLSSAENRFEKTSGKLLEVYTPLTATDGTPLLVEAYSRYASVAASGRRQWVVLAPALIGALLLLWALLVPFAWSLARRLRDRHREREALMLRAIEASDLERRRIAADLHDGPVQSMAGVSFALAAAADRAGAGEAPDLEPALRDASARARQSMRELRAALVEIHPPNLERAGLLPALNDLAAPLSRQGVDVDVDVALPSRFALTPEVEALLFRGAQEALRNVAKHADARHVIVRVTERSGAAVLAVTDDGRGYSGRPGDPGHMGLVLLDGLAGDAGGRLDVRAPPEGGTRLTLEVPL